MKFLFTLHGPNIYIALITFQALFNYTKMENWTTSCVFRTISCDFQLAKYFLYLIAQVFKFFHTQN